MLFSTKIHTFQTITCFMLIVAVWNTLGIWVCLGSGYEYYCLVCSDAVYFSEHVTTFRISLFSPSLQFNMNTPNSCCASPPKQNMSKLSHHVATLSASSAVSGPPPSPSLQFSKGWSHTKGPTFHVCQRWKPALTCHAPHTSSFNIWRSTEC